MTVTIPGHIAGESVVSLVNVPLLDESVLEGSVVSVAGSVVELSNTDLTDGEFVEYGYNNKPLYGLEIVEAANSNAVGITVGIIANSESGVTLSESVAGLVSGGDRIRIRRFSTLESVFGESNVAGLVSGGNASESDIVYLVGDSGQLETYYYQTASSRGGGNGWRKVGSFTENAGNSRIEWGAVMVFRNTNQTVNPIDFTLAGQVLMGEGKRGVYQGLNLVGYPFPVGTTLGGLGINPDDLQSGINAAQSDIIYLVDGSNQLATYYYQTASVRGGGNGWRKIGSNTVDQADTEIGPSDALLILRKGPSSFYINSPPIN